MGWWDWLVQGRCVLCQRSVSPGERCFCRDCRRQIQGSRYPSWGSRVILPSGATTQLYAWGRYEGSLRQALRCLKYERQPEIGHCLGDWIGHDWERQWGRQWTVIPIPLHPDKRQQRGYNQAELISQRFCEQTGCDHQPHLLQRIRATTPQHGLSAQDRRQNVAQAFAVYGQPPSPVVLVDDIFTTGSTVSTAIQALQDHGIPVFGVVVAARPSFALPSQAPIDVF
ncbi:MAG: ComF family protein [Synechococcales cyanobacterium]